jgi:creatinine amidohydrolase
MQLVTSTWQEVEAYLQTSTGIIIPTGSTEQHGPNGLIGTDAICAEIMAREVGEAEGILVGPTLALGVAQFNLAFPGTISVSPTTMIAVVVDYVRSLERSGFTHFYFLNGHGGNIAPVRSAFQEIYMQTSLGEPGNSAAVRCRLRSWWDHKNTNQLRYDLYGDWEGWHATAAEVSIAQWAHPDQIKDDTMSDPVAVSDTYVRDHAGDDHFDATHHRAIFPDGRIGSDPSLSKPEDGRKLVESAIPEIAADFAAFLAES